MENSRKRDRLAAGALGKNIQSAPFVRLAIQAAKENRSVFAIPTL
jgi:hypothetical protein